VHPRTVVVYGPRRVLALAILTTFLGAALLFVVQPLAARTLLPVLGGSPAVWNTAMVFFQTALLAGYLWAHVSVRVLGVQRQSRAHVVLALLAVALLPVLAPATAPPADASPASWLLIALAAMVGPFVVVLSANAPLVQRWFAASGHPASRDPYFLYAASNAGSLLALGAYPLVIEPRTTLAQQWRWWAVGYGVFAVCTAIYALLATRHALDPVAAEPAPPGTMRERARWLLLALVPSSLLLAVTQLLSTDVAAVPLLWVLPLGVYLLTFIVAFARRPPITAGAASAALPWLAVPMAVTSFLLLPGVPVWSVIALQLVGLFVAALACHGRLADERPPPARLTEFYLLLALGGVLGGAMTALVAPLAFTWVAEYPIALVAACLLRLPARRDRPVLDVVAPALALAAFFAAGPVLRAVVDDPWWVAAGPYFAVAGVCLLLAPRRAGFGLALAVLLGLAQLSPEDSNRTVYRARTFFGVHRVTSDPDGFWHSLSHGVTEHGRQAQQGDMRRVPTMYYHPTGPLGDVIRAGRGTGRLDAVAGVGLGTGALAAYGRAGERMDFFEIDPAVVQIARDPALFSFLGDSAATTRVVLGDARLRLAAEPPDATYDLLVLDAFSSDAIPVHLITTEALDLYAARLRPGGLIAAHVTNRHLDLVPVLAAAAAVEGLDGLVRAERELSDDERAQAKEASTWVALARPGTPALEALRRAGWQPLPAPEKRVWTDDYVDLIGALRTRR
jgi:hypothetical protein